MAPKAETPHSPLLLRRQLRAPLWAGAGRDYFNCWVHEVKIVGYGARLGALARSLVSPNKNPLVKRTDRPRSLLRRLQQELFLHEDLGQASGSVHARSSFPRDRGAAEGHQGKAAPRWKVLPTERGLEEVPGDEGFCGAMVHSLHVQPSKLLRGQSLETFTLLQS